MSRSSDKYLEHCREFFTIEQAEKNYLIELEERYDRSNPKQTNRNN